MEGTENNHHPLLRGGRRQSSYSHGYSSAQIQTLASMCEALIPPLIPNENPLHKSLQTFYEASGSQSPIPDEAAEMVVKKALPPAASLVSWVLKILSFRLGTLLLCGFICFDWKWPFLHTFSEMSLERREAVLKKWSKQRRFVPLRLAFVLIKLFCFFTFFSRVDENSHNPAWEAIGYHVDTRKRMTKTEKERPLDNGVIETKKETDSSLVQSLIQKGIEVTEDPNDNTYKIQCDAELKFYRSIR